MKDNNSLIQEGYLRRAVRNCDIEEVRRLCQEGTKPEEHLVSLPPLWSGNILHYAIEYTMVTPEMVDLLMKIVGNDTIESKDSDGATALYLAVKNGKIEVAACLIKNHSADANWIFTGFYNSIQEDPLRMAVRNGDTKEVRRLCPEGTKPEEHLVSLPPFWNGNILHYAIKYTMVTPEMVDLLMKSADNDTIELKDSDGATALYLAFQKGNRKVADCLITKHFANVNGAYSIFYDLIPYNNILTQEDPLRRAVRKGDTKEVRRLCPEGTKPEEHLVSLPPFWSGNILHYAIEYTMVTPEMVDLLMKIVGNDTIESKDSDGATALYLAVKNGKIEVADCLIKNHSANVNWIFSGFYNVTLLDAAIANKDLPMVELLLSRGANPDLCVFLEKFQKLSPSKMAEDIVNPLHYYIDRDRDTITDLTYPLLSGDRGETFVARIGASSSSQMQR